MQAELLGSTGSIADQIRTLLKNHLNTVKLTTTMRGTVTNTAPLEITVSSGQTYSEEFLNLSHNVKDYKVDITVSHTTENKAGGQGDAQFESHNHAYTGRKTIIIHNGLQVGEEVYLLRQHGGQSFFVLDRVNDPIISGQWGG